MTTRLLANRRPSHRFARGVMQEEVQYEVSRLGDAIEPILLAVMGALVLLLMLGIFLPLWDLGQLAQQT